MIIIIVSAVSTKEQMFKVQSYLIIFVYLF